MEKEKERRDASGGEQADGKLFWNEVFFEAGFYAR